MNKNKTLRLIFPQWQGGNNMPYFFGAQLLNWLAPKTNGPVETVSVQSPDEKIFLKDEEGIFARHKLIQQLEDAISKINHHQPEKLVILGGDCLVDLAPFAYLSEKYGNELAVLWIDAHPDIMTPEQFNHAHAMVLGNLLGYGDKQFREYVKKPLNSKNVCYLGVNEPTEWEENHINHLGLNNISPEQLRNGGDTLLRDWFKSTGAKYLAIHLDLDVLDPQFFKSLLFTNPHIDPKTFDGIAQGKLCIDEVVNAITSLNEIAEVVGIGITEYFPWDALALKNMMEKLPLIGD